MRGSSLPKVLEVASAPRMLETEESVLHGLGHKTHLLGRVASARTGEGRTLRGSSLHRLLWMFDGGVERRGGVVKSQAIRRGGQCKPSSRSA
jgi:hypothetical protein